MLLKTLLLQDPRWHPHPQPIRVHWLAAGEQQHLVVEAPNWANAQSWGAQAALLAWQELALEEPPQAALAILNPSDPQGLALWVVQPGFPKAHPALWREPFERYAQMSRAATLVWPARPIPGTARVCWGRPLGASDALARWAQPVPLVFAD